jgi:hypothetical protein
MKHLFTFLIVAFMGLSSSFAQTDAEITANWQFPIDWWFPNAPVPEGGVENYPHFQAKAQLKENFNPQTVNFDEAWTGISGDGNIIGSTPSRISGLPESNKGSNDFKDAAFKVIYDESNMYILLQWTDDDVTGSESAELCISPYFKLDVDDKAQWYSRYSQFGANKLQFNNKGFSAAMMVNFDVDGKGSINWGGTTETLTNNLFLDDKSVTGSKTVKWIITIGYPALTGEFRPDFNVDIWKALNSGKGISFDLKVNDVDTDDAFNTDATPVQKPAEYWWSSQSNDAWQSNMYAGFLGAKGPGDAELTAKWQFPVDWWFPNAPVPEGGVENYPRFQATSHMKENFNPVSDSFDKAWSGIPGNGNVIGSTPAHALGLPGSNKGANDFKDAAFKVMHDADNIYILLQWTDDDVTGSESAELCISPYFKLDVDDKAQWYSRYSQFGANKLQFNNKGFSAAMMVNFDVDGKGSINWGGTTETLTNNLFVDDKSVDGSKTVKWIITIGYPALTGEFRPDFNEEIWKSLNSGKGISFDLKVNDVDTDDAFNSDATPVQKPAEYWWSSTSNDAWQSNMYAGFLNVGDPIIETGPTDAEITANWQFPIDWWFPNAPVPEGGVENYPRFEAAGQFKEGFNPETAKFDETWSSIAGKGNVIGSTPAHTLGLPESNKGSNDFKDAAFKVLYDEGNMYILLQWTDDDVTGSESAELCISPYFKLDVDDKAQWYSRYSQFGANKLQFNNKGFSAAMMVNFDVDGKGSINWGGTTETLTSNLFLDDKSVTGSKTVKWIITIGYPALTGEFRPDFNVDIWKALNSGKGISFDLKVNDVDTDDAFNSDATPVQKPAEYWWSSTSNDAWQSNMYAGFLKAGDSTASLPTTTTWTDNFDGSAVSSLWLPEHATDPIPVFTLSQKGGELLVNVDKTTGIESGIPVYGFSALVLDLITNTYLDLTKNPVVEVKVKTDETFTLSVGLVQSSVGGNDVTLTQSVNGDNTYTTLKFDFTGKLAAKYDPAKIDKVYLNFTPGWDAAGKYKGNVTFDYLKIGDAATAVKQIYNPDDLAVYPNPANNTISIKNASSMNIQSIAISNVSGQLVKTMRTFDGGQINVQDLRSGVYFVRVLSNDNTVNTLRFIKQ